ncbi:MAG: HD domain-containing protein [Bacteroidales bacterium]
MTADVLQQTEVFVSNLLSTKLSPKNYYHNIIHTRRVVDYALVLAKEEGCGEADTILVQLAAWFHDVGFTLKDEGHEEDSARQALAFLSDKGLSAEQLDVVRQLILSTKSGVEPHNVLENILKDADSGHLASEDFMIVAEHLRTELSMKQGEDISEIDWQRENLEFLRSHKYYTHYAQQVWQAHKELNLFKVQQKIDKVLAKEAKKKGISKPGRGIETLFRVELKNHVDLSFIADTKANILLSVNAIIISVALGTLVPKLDSQSNAFLVIPTLVLICFSVASIVLSVLSTRPNVSKMKVSRDMVINKHVFR